jgi:hypothetical protein
MKNHNMGTIKKLRLLRNLYSYLLNLSSTIALGVQYYGEVSRERGRGFSFIGVSMHFPSYDRWMGLGSLLGGSGAACTFGWFIYARQSDGKTVFLAPSGMAFLVITGVGFLLFIIGFFKPKGEESRQSLPPSASAGDSGRVAYDIDDDGEVESYGARIRNQDTAFKVRGRGKLRDKNTDVG